MRAVDCQLRARNLCRKLTELLFTEEELRVGNATEARTAGVNLLDSHRLYALRGKILCIYADVQYRIIQQSCIYNSLSSTFRLQFTVYTGSLKRREFSISLLSRRKREVEAVKTKHNKCYVQRSSK